ncbi:MAG TPA: type II toxin-antitoxin system VapC family toxin [Rhizomicrobium sp.]|jgi:PIN domain nuclease of toxin-antitoxin system|nr:type II toxin-antitoxin system VapC family toxin [Rhizomicrobium sp.]
MKQPLLLDTCVCIWLLNDELTPKAEQALTDAYHEGIPAYVSPITALEIGTMARKQRWKAPLPPRKWFATLIGQPGIALAQMPAELLLESALLPGGIHDDPYDRILAATAREYGYTLMTRDRALLAYARDGHLSALEC